MSELDDQYKKAVIEISKKMPDLIAAIRELSLKIERYIKLGR